MRYFSFAEFERSETAARLGIDNAVPAALRGNVEVLVDRVLDPLREAWGKPIVVTSGYRCPALNKAVGGSGTSHHMRGMAADISTGDRVENRKLFQKIIDLGLPFTQLIDEKGFQWVHVSLDPGNVKREVLKL